MRYSVYDAKGDLYAYATSRKDADKAARECGGSVVDQQRKGLEGPFRAANNKPVYYDPRAGLYYDPTSDMYLERDEDPFARRNPGRPSLPTIYVYGDGAVWKFTKRSLRDWALGEDPYDWESYTRMLKSVKVDADWEYVESSLPKDIFVEGNGLASWARGTEAWHYDDMKDLWGYIREEFL